MSARSEQGATGLAPVVELNDLRPAHRVAKELADNKAITAINISALEQVAKELAMGDAQTP